MANLTTSSDIDTFMGSANNAAARTNLGVLPLAGGTLTGQLIQSTAGAASTAALVMSGAPYKAGTATTNHPLFYFNQAGATAPTNWSLKGTSFGMSLPAADSYPNYGDAMRVLVDNVSMFSVDKAGGVYAKNAIFLGTSINTRSHGINYQSASRMNIVAADTYIAAATASGLFCSSAAYFGWTDGTSYAGTVDALLIRGGAAACVQMGADAAGVTNQHFKACNRITSDGVGANLTISGGNGRGGAGGSLILATYDTQSAATPGVLTTRMTLDTVGLLTLANGVNLSLVSTKIGNATTDALAFWGTTPTTQPVHIGDPTGDSGTGLDTVDKTVLDATLTDIQASIASINAMLAITGLTAAT